MCYSKVCSVFFKEIYLRGRLIVISGPSGVGKDCVLCEMRRLNSDTLVSVSATTRLPRSGEVDGKDYYFFSKQDFENKIKNNEFIEYATYCGNYYGTLKFPLEKNLVSGKDVILKIEVQGATKI
ncbi:MAG: hypothetical protein FWC41_06760, partial [Firmicutes bacterium]|nr:hypothetical protein [Bacillota bacterium]